MWKVPIYMFRLFDWIWFGKKLFLDLANFACSETLNANVRFSLFSKNTVITYPQCFGPGFIGSRIRIQGFDDEKLEKFDIS
jgi:hypothetical protein